MTFLAILMFGDDVKTISPRFESAVLQEDIHAIHLWTQEWDLPLIESIYNIISVSYSPISQPFMMSKFQGILECILT